MSLHSGPGRSHKVMFVGSSSSTKRLLSVPYTVAAIVSIYLLGRCSLYVNLGANWDLALQIVKEARSVLAMAVRHATKHSSLK